MALAVRIVDHTMLFFSKPLWVGVGGCWVMQSVSGMLMAWNLLELFWSGLLRWLIISLFPSSFKLLYMTNLKQDAGWKWLMQTTHANRWPAVVHSELSNTFLWVPLLCYDSQLYCSLCYFCNIKMSLYFCFYFCHISVVSKILCFIIFDFLKKKL